MSYDRRANRVAYRCPVMVTTPDGASVLGEVVDLSGVGAGLLLPLPPSRIAKGARVTMLIEAHDLPDPDGDGAIITLRGVVAAVQAKTPMGPTRFGVAFAVEAPDVARRLSTLAPARIASGTGPGAVLPAELADTHVLAPASGQTGRGREHLFQAALLALRAAEPERAIELIGWALAHDAQNESYRALLHVAQAEQALRREDAAAARGELASARSLRPESPEVTALAARVPPEKLVAKKGFFAKLLGR